METLKEPQQLIAKYSQRAPDGLRELLESEVATVEQAIRQRVPGFAPFIRLLTNSGQMWQFDVQGPPLVETAREAWHELFPQLVRDRDAQALGFALTERTPHPLHHSSIVVVTCHALSPEGHQAAQCQVDGEPGRPFQRLTDWWVAPVAEARGSGDTNSTLVIAALREVAAEHAPARM